LQELLKILKKKVEVVLFEKVWLFDDNPSELFWHLGNIYMVLK